MRRGKAWWPEGGRRTLRTLRPTPQREDSEYDLRPSLLASPGATVPRLQRPADAEGPAWCLYTTARRGGQTSLGSGSVVAPTRSRARAIRSHLLARVRLIRDHRTREGHGCCSADAWGHGHAGKRHHATSPRGGRAWCTNGAFLPASARFSSGMDDVGIVQRPRRQQRHSTTIHGCPYPRGALRVEVLQR